MPRKPAARYGKPTNGYRSGLEADVAAFIEAQGIVARYEAGNVPFIKPAETRRYIPDLILPNAVILEVKGLFTSADRKKHKQIRESNPDLDIRFVFGNANNRLSKKSATTYAKWCETHGFLWAHRVPPLAWLNEPTNRRSLAALAELGLT